MDIDVLAFVALVVLALIELVLSGSFSRPYFRFGIPIFIVRLPARERGLPDFEERLESEFSSGLTPPLVFRRFSPTEVGFRERAFGWRVFSYTPVMHGLIRLAPSEGTVYVIGWLNWFTAAFVAALIAFSQLEPIFPIFAAGVIVLIYIIQSRRYRAVASRLWPQAV